MDKVAIVLGTSSGLGLACAESLLEKNYQVFGASRTESEINHDRFFEFEVDITQESEIKRFMIEVEKEAGPVDLLVNTCGICDMLSIENTQAKDLRSHFETNVIGHFNVLKYFSPLIVSEETHILNVFSISAKSLYSNTLCHSVSEFSKKALVGVLEKEWKKYDIRFSNFFVGAIDTPLWQDYLDIDTSQMLDVSDFIYMFNCVTQAPSHMKFPEITFLHKNSFID